jgi:hypothetical protein
MGDGEHVRLPIVSGSVSSLGSWWSSTTAQHSTDDSPNPGSGPHGRALSPIWELTTPVSLFTTLPYMERDYTSEPETDKVDNRTSIIANTTSTSTPSASPGRHSVETARLGTSDITSDDVATPVSVRSPEVLGRPLPGTSPYQTIRPSPTGASSSSLSLATPSLVVVPAVRPPLPPIPRSISILDPAMLKRNDLSSSNLVPDAVIPASRPWRPGASRRPHSFSRLSRLETERSDEVSL